MWQFLDADDLWMRRFVDYDDIVDSTNNNEPWAHEHDDINAYLEKLFAYEPRGDAT